MKKSPSSPAPSAAAPSVSQRVESLTRTITLLKMALRVNGEADTEQDSDWSLNPIEIDALSSLVVAADEEVWWLSRLPRAVLDTPAPDDDQREAMEAVGAR